LPTDERTTDVTVQAGSLPESAAPTPDPSREAAYWFDVLRPYTEPRLSRSMFDVLTSAVAYIAVSVGMYFALRVSVLITLALAPVAAVFVLRTYIVFHDCAHGSFLPWRRANIWLGKACGVLVLTPFVRWRHDHALHHASSGDLDRRGTGDVPTMTVAEFEAASPGKRLGYRMFRSPLVMFGLGPLFAMIIGPRIVPRRLPKRLRNSILGTDVTLGIIAGLLTWQVGLGTLMLVWAPPALLAGSVGVWLFYVQHQFEDAYWRRSEEWCYADAALCGSSYLKLPRLLQFATGNIGLHHIHHLSVRIPNYNLQRAHDENEVFTSVPVLSLRAGLRACRLRLWDERAGRLVTFAQARAPGAGAAA
jgi:omega-6 fatty acid desaturase (delta-12 desaturase)